MNFVMDPSFPLFFFGFSQSKQILWGRRKGITCFEGKYSNFAGENKIIFKIETNVIFPLKFIILYFTNTHTHMYSVLFIFENV